MPRVKHQQSIARQWEILKRLPSKGPGVTARELSEWVCDEGYPATKRTVERDLSDLAELFPIVCNDKSTPYGWHWMEGKGADLPGVTVADAVSLTLVEGLVRPLLPAAILEALEPRFSQARTKLKAHAKDSANARWVDKVRYVPPALPLVPPKIAGGVLGVVQEALLSERQLEASYQRPDDKPSRLVLHPLGLVQRGPVTYLVATAFGYDDVRLYAVHRIRKASVTAEPGRRPNGFSLDAYIAKGALEFGADEEIKLEAWVSDDLAAVLTETPLAADQRLVGTGDGGARLSATVRNSWQLQWWILSQGAGITVLKPLDLKKSIAFTLAEATTNYLLGKHGSHGQ